MHFEAIHQDCVVVLRDEFGPQQKLSTTRGYTFHTEDQKKYFLGTKTRAGSSAAHRQTNRPRFEHAYTMYDE